MPQMTHLQIEILVPILDQFNVNYDTYVKINLKFVEFLKTITNAWHYSYIYGSWNNIPESLTKIVIVFENTVESSEKIIKLKNKLSKLKKDLNQEYIYYNEIPCKLTLI